MKECEPIDGCCVIRTCSSDPRSVTSASFSIVTLLSGIPASLPSNTYTAPRWMLFSELKLGAEIMTSAKPSALTSALNRCLEKESYLI